MVNFFNSERVDVVMFYDGNTKLACKSWIGRFPNRAISCAQIFTSVVQHLIIVPSNSKVTIVVLIEPEEYYKQKNKFWNTSKKSSTSALANLQLQLELYSL
ncbi:hypothetical protein Zmor_002255 [Zophobas morio]|uniref:Uncharacterized protein n=1 Tax=Zophobas morio TaxID=2755281 RepID=A0AA38J0L3_9CUCU|nr:hypothetical protein Zmor_002255 [Zophobas morio]